jgi:hypothetical protein
MRPIIAEIFECGIIHYFCEKSSKKVKYDKIIENENLPRQKSEQDFRPARSHQLHYEITFTPALHSVDKASIHEKMILSSPKLIFLRFSFIIFPSPKNAHKCPQNSLSFVRDTLH